MWNTPEHSPEVGRILHLEHFNFEVPDQDMATVFFMKGLGLTRDPYRRTDETNMGVNIGRQQLHLPVRGEGTPHFDGVVGLVVPDLDQVEARLKVLQSHGAFTDTPFALVREESAALITSPYGIRIRLHNAGSIPSLLPLGLAYVDYDTPEGSAEGIAAFYSEILGSPAHVVSYLGARTAEITMGPHQTVRFIERGPGPFDHTRVHIAVYVSHYHKTRKALAAMGIEVGEERNGTFFWNRILDPGTGKIILAVGHETRSVYHPDFMRPLINRWPMETEPFTDYGEVMAYIDGKWIPRTH